MSSNVLPLRRIDAADVGFAVVVLAATLAVVPAQLGWIVLVDATGWDARLPEPVFLLALPAVTVAVAPTIAAVDVYGPTRGAAVGAGLLLAAAGVATLSVGLWALCGGC